MEKKYTFHVSGMHCKACVLMTESELQDVPEVASAKTFLANNSVDVVGDFGEKTPEQIAEDLTVVLEKHGYKLSTEQVAHQKKWSDFKIAAPIALIFLALFIALQKLNIVNLDKL